MRGDGFKLHLTAVTLGLTLSTTGCSAGDEPSRPEPATLATHTPPMPSTPPTRPAWVQLEVEHWLPGPAGRERPDAGRVELDRECRRCHGAHAREWGASRHAAAWTDPTFRAAFELEPQPFCQGCHAPEAFPFAAVPSEVGAMGVACVTCHVDPDSPSDSPTVFASPRAGAAEDAPHEIRRSEAFAGPQVCARCHEFAFPDHALRERELLMQSTISEHRESRARWRSCVDCHMPARTDADGARHDHGFAGAFDVDMLARALDVRVERPSPTTVRLQLLPGEVGHAVPTGDLLRRLEVALVLERGDGSTLVLDRRWLGRRFATQLQANGLAVREQVTDDRVGPRGRVIELYVPEQHRSSDALGWRVTHQRVAHGSSEPRDAPIAGQLVMAQGSVPSSVPPSVPPSTPSTSTATTMRVGR